ncbi:MAG: asparaginase [Candidatus Diapherotrites archaeon]
MKKNNKKPKVLVIGLGGAISAKLKNEHWDYGTITQKELIESTQRIKENFEIDAIDLFRMDSADIKPEQWLTLANTIYHKMQNYDGIVVTMGTDTLSYTATAIAFMIQKNNIPIVFTGSQMDPEQINTDAKRNLRGAITIAGTSNIAETLVFFNNKIMKATTCKKTNATELDAFSPIGDKIIGTLQQSITIEETNYRKRTKTKPKLYSKIDTEVALVKVYPGFEGKRLINLINNGATGIVLEGFGLGNLPLIDTGLKEAIKYANKKKAPVVVTSNTPLGKYWKTSYKTEIGQRFKQINIIKAYDMLPETAYVKLMWVLGQTKEPEKIEKMMLKNYAGEINYSTK